MERSDPTIHIRLAEECDTTAIASVLYESFIEYQASYTPAAFTATTPTPAQIQKRLSEGSVWVAWHHDALVGTISAVEQGAGLYLRSMAVLPSARGYGVGRGLVEHVEQFAIAQGYHYLVLRTTPFLTHAIRLYEQVGFQRITAGPHDLYGTPLLTMLKPLVRTM